MSDFSIVLLDHATWTRGDLDLSPLEALGTVTAYDQTPASEVGQRVSEADVVLSNKVMLDAAALNGSKKLKLICVCATGVNNVDLDAARAKGIRVVNASGYSTQSVAQHAMAFILNWSTQMHRWLPEASKWAESPVFTRLDYPVIELVDKTIGLVGAGRIGFVLGKLAEAFGMTVRAWARPGGKGNGGWPRLALQELLGASDVVSLHCPLTDSTRHLINRESLGWMKKGAFLVNTGRGDLIEETALVEALKQGQLSGAGLDVLSVEPPPPDHPLLRLGHPNLMITPHTAWTTREARSRLLNEVVENIRAFLRGEDRNRVA